MADKPKSRRDAIVAMLRNPTPEQLAVLSGGVDLPKATKAIREAAAALDRLLKLDPETGARVVRNAERFEHDVKTARLGSYPPPPTSAASPTTIRAKFEHWLDGLSPTEQQQSNRQLALRYINRGGVGSEKYLRDTASAWKQKPRNQ